MPKISEHYGKFRYRYTDHAGKRRCSPSFDTRKEAEEHRDDTFYELRKIRQGLKQPYVTGKTFGSIADYWLENRASNLQLKRSYKSDRSIIEKHLRPFFGNHILMEINIDLIDKYRSTKLLLLNKKTVSNHLILLGSMFRVARDLRWLNEIPRIIKPKIKINQHDFNYLRTQLEIDRFLRSAAEESELIHILYATALNTGLRAGELAGLQWDDIDFTNRILTVQRSYEGPTKSDTVRYVPILNSIYSLLKVWRLKCPGNIVFPNQSGKPHKPSDRIFQEILRRILKRAGFATVIRNTKQRSYIRFHDLRHTFASHWMMKGGDIFKLQKILGHSTIHLTMRYAHLAPHAFHEDYDRLGPAMNPTTTACISPLKTKTDNSTTCSLENFLQKKS